MTPLYVDAEDARADVQKAEERVALLEQTVKMLMRELAHHRPSGPIDRQLEEALGHARVALRAVKIR